MSISRKQVLTHDARYIISDNQGRKYTFETNVATNGKTAYFVWTFRGCKRLYVGKVNTHTLQVEPTNKSALPTDDYAWTLLNKLLARVECNDHTAYTSKGYDINLVGSETTKPSPKPQLTVAQVKAEMAKKCNCMKEEDGRVEEPSGSCPVHGWMVVTESEKIARDTRSLVAQTPVAIAQAPGGASLPDEADEDDYGPEPAPRDNDDDTVPAETNGTTHTDTTSDFNTGSMSRAQGAAATRVNMAGGFFSVNDSDEQKAQVMQQMADNLSGDLWSFEYDIPESKSTEVPNPSGWLWQFACRKTLSCWILTDKGLKAEAVQEYLGLCKDHNITVDLIRYHPADQAKVRDRIRQRLAEHIQSIHASLVDRIASGSERLAGLVKAIDCIVEHGPETGSQVAEMNLGVEKKIVDQARKLCDESSRVSEAKDRAARLNDNALRSLLKSIGEDLDHAIKCAQMFEETENMSALFEGARAALKVNKDAFNARMHQTGGKLAQ